MALGGSTIPPLWILRSLLADRCSGVDRNDSCGGRMQETGGLRFAGADMSDDRLTQELATRVMGWKVVPDRFLMSNRRWKPRWRFQPCRRLEDAFSLLE